MIKYYVEDITHELAYEDEFFEGLSAITLNKYQGGVFFTPP